MRSQGTSLAAAVLTACIGVVSSMACGDAAAPQPAQSSGSTSSTSSSSSSSGSSGDQDSGPPQYVFDDGSGTGTTWSNLYSQFFGPSGRASCAGTAGACHGSSSATGAKRSAFICADATGCHDSMLGSSNLVKSSDASAPQSSLLISVLRTKKSDGSIVGTQPTSPLFVFHSTSIERIKTWIGNGAAP